MIKMKHKRTFTTDQVKRMANILDNAGQVIFATAVLPSTLGLIDDETSKMLALIGIILTIFCWWMSLKLERVSS